MAALKSIMKTAGWYSLIIPENHIEIDSVAKLEVASDYAVMALKQYMDKFFAYNRKQWEAPYMSYYALKADDSNFVKEYTIKYTVDTSKDIGAETIGKFVDDVNSAIKKDSCIKGFEISAHHDIITAFDFTKHLYAPLVSVQDDFHNIEVSPVSMNEGEKKFVKLVNQYVEENQSVFDGKGLYLLRNKSKSGMGFFEAGNFYPDFILWITEPGVQRISFKQK